MTAREGTSPPTAAADTERLRLAGNIGQQCARLTRLFSAAKHELAEMRVNGLEHAGYLLLAWLVNDGPQRNAALAERAHFDPSTVSRLVGALARRGLVERRADPDDGRASLIAATADGEALLAAYRAQRDSRIAEALAAWSIEDQETLAALLPRLYDAFEGMLPEPRDGSCGPAASAPSITTTTTERATTP